MPAITVDDLTVLPRLKTPGWATSRARCGRCPPPRRASRARASRCAARSPASTSRTSTRSS